MIRTSDSKEAIMDLKTMLETKGKVPFIEVIKEVGFDEARRQLGECLREGLASESYSGGDRVLEKIIIVRRVEADATSLRNA
jgi:hypothetical protein